MKSCDDKHVTVGCGDTIAAVATAPGMAGIAVVRISGPNAWPVGARVAGVQTWPRTAAGTFRRATFFQVPDSGGRVAIDDGVVLLYAAPRSYTGEDVVELQCHGGRFQARGVLASALASGARMAEPGEFTRRAFLAGKIDLSRAEAVMDFISARTERAAASARMQMEGRLSATVDGIYDRLVEIASSIEHLLDFDEGEVPDSFFEDAARDLAALDNDLASLAATWREGHLLREGALAVICGRPNAGKSSLLNALLGRERAIVSAVPGTTRDSIEESFDAGGVPVRLVDTAGLRDAVGDAIEAEGVARSEALIENADLVIRVVDASSHVPAVELRAISSLPPRRAIVVLNKMDVADEGACDAIAAGTPATTCRVSAKTGEGIKALVDAIGAALCAAPTSSLPEISSRHHAEVVAARGKVSEACESLARGGDGLVLAAESLRGAADSLGRITGRIWSDELLDKIFGTFCVGK